MVVVTDKRDDKYPQQKPTYIEILCLLCALAIHWAVKWNDEEIKEIFVCRDKKKWSKLVGKLS